MERIRIPEIKPLYEQVVDLIEEKILSGELRLGDRLPTENELTTIYKVSRTVIREAMKTLKERGWVETLPAKGTFVVDHVAKGVGLSFDRAIRNAPDGGYNYLIKVREILEPEIAALAAAEASKKHIAALGDTIHKMNYILNTGYNIEEFLKADFSFHMLLAESTGNPLIMLVLDPIVQLMRGQQEYYLLNVEESGQKSLNFHELILNAVETRDAAAARRYMYEHIYKVRMDIEQCYTVNSNNHSPVSRRDLDA
jgi:GntR family transcriptional repressor for pyruvate dehydrogenase complex